MKAFGGLIIPKMANFDSRTYCNTRWMISGTSKNRPKIDQLWTLRPRIYDQNTSKDTRNIMGTFLKHVIFSYLNFLEIQKNPNSGHHRTPTYFDNFVSYFGNFPPTQSSSLSVFDKNLQGNIFETPLFLQNPKT